VETLFLFATLVVLTAAERHPKLRYMPLPLVRRYFGTDALCLLTGVLLLGLALQSWAGAGAGLFALPRVQPAAWPCTLLFPVTIALYDLGGWVSHVLLHRTNVLWEIHKVHHSSLALDWLATFRAHILEHALRHFLSPVLLLLLGFPVVVVGLAAATYGAWAALGHSNLALPLGALESFLVTPRLHRLHHVPGTSEKNFGTITSLWDRLAGTLHRDPSARLAPIGVPGEISTYPQTWGRQWVEPFRRLRLRLATE
jgi:sterol desaturase/sphingolipid hydroxylase (fatty acid hydroxylase superfamily)